MIAPDRAPLRLTQFSHGGGCGCKIAPAVLQQIIARSGSTAIPKELLVGIETSDDAAVYLINEHQAIVATTDFFMPIVDDPFDFGAIAATNAISDIYAMGGTPLFALALVGMPVDKLPVETIRRILDGGEAVCARAGIPIAGGHTIDSVEPIYGLVAIGLVDPKNIKRNAGAQPGDALILGKALGIGIYSAALKKGKLAGGNYATLVASATQLNTPGIALGTMPRVHALTDVTGFGLAGHLLEICRASGVGATIDIARIPLHPDVLDLARSGVVTGASDRNWAGYGQEVDLAAGLADAERALLCDPQTSGGLLVACAPDTAGDVLALFRAQGFDRAAVIGNVTEGVPRVTVR
jgi:selenide,water dikinase